MAKQFKEQGGAATMDPSPWFRWLSSAVIRRLMSPGHLVTNRRKFEQQRVKDGRKHVVEYFHQIDDGYSHLAAQALKSLAVRYDIELRCHLVTGPQGKNSAEPELLIGLSRYDSSLIAPEYGLNFPKQTDAPKPALLELASMILAAQSHESFIHCAAAVGDALWGGDVKQLKALAKQHGEISKSDLAATLEAGNAHRAALKHYSGGMFYYGEEWYWGVDRLHYLETRLGELGADLQPQQPLVMPRPTRVAADLKDTGTLTLEVYPSLRSPYSAMIFDQVVALAKNTCVTLSVRPVLPMVMRGVPATREKGLYIFSDACREARYDKVRFGNFYDPIGEPVRRCYSLYPWACEQAQGTELLSSFLRAAFIEGVNTNNDRGLRKVVEAAGLDWAVAKTIVGNDGWQQSLEDNRLAMYEAGLWGVPSMRLLDEKGDELLALWGQDRLWLFAREIQRQLAARQHE